MATETQIQPDLVLGSRVRIKNYSGPDGKIVELRGPLGPNGMQIYRVAIAQRRGFSLVELRGNQLELIRVLPRRRFSSKLKRLRRAMKLKIRRPRSLS